MAAPAATGSLDARGQAIGVLGSTPTAATAAAVDSEVGEGDEGSGDYEYGGADGSGCVRVAVLGGASPQAIATAAC